MHRDLAVVHLAARENLLPKLFAERLRGVVPAVELLSVPRDTLASTSFVSHRSEGFAKQVPELGGAVLNDQQWDVSIDGTYRLDVESHASENIVRPSSAVAP